jgi:uncharacterized protein (TIGR02246 family)
MMSMDARDREAIEAIPERFANGWNRHDMNEAFAEYADDADFVTVMGAWWHGKKAIVDNHAAMHEVFSKSVLRFTRTQSRFLGSDSAVVHGIWKMTGHFDPQRRWGNERSGILSFVVQRQSGQWRVVASQETDCMMMQS